MDTGAETDLNYNNQVATWLDEIKPGWRTIEDICVPENEKIFVAAVKAYIDDGWGDVYFDSTYKKLRKIDISGFLTKTVEA